jgi:hypothetical protein
MANKCLNQQPAGCVMFHFVHSFLCRFCEMVGINQTCLNLSGYSFQYFFLSNTQKLMGSSSVLLLGDGIFFDWRSVRYSSWDHMNPKALKILFIDEARKKRKTFLIRTRSCMPVLQLTDNYVINRTVSSPTFVILEKIKCEARL